MRIALIDDSYSALIAVEGYLRPLENIELHRFHSAEDALANAALVEFDLFVCDYTMPGMDGIEFVQRLRKMAGHTAVPFVMVTASGQTDICRRAIEAGATDFLFKPIDAVQLLARVRNLLALRRAHVEMRERARLLDGAMALASHTLSHREEEIIWRLARAIDARDGDTGGHVSRMANICLVIARELGLPPDACRTIYLAAPLHDVGKIGIPDSILTKPGRLTEDEYAVMRTHVEIGVKILEDGSSDLIRIAEIIAGGHHERWDGTGYPKGLAGLQIPLEARIAAIADVFEALCTERPYKRAWPLEEAGDEISRQAGKLFDPACVEAFLRCWPQIVAYMEDNRTSTEPFQPAGKSSAF